MSAPQLPPTQKPEQQPQHKAYQEREEVKLIEGGKSHEKSPDKREKSEEETKTEVKAVIDEQKLLKQRKSIFSCKKENNNQGNIFANSKSVNLFNKLTNPEQKETINIFTLPSSSQPLLVNDPEDDLVSHSSQEHALEGNEFRCEPVQKVMKYKYQEQTTKLGEFRLSRFKNSSEPTKEKAVLSLQEKKEGSKEVLLLLVRNECTKVICYQAWLLPNAKVHQFMNKPQNLTTSVMRIKREEGSIKHQREDIKMQFLHQQEAELFRKIHQDYFNKDREDCEGRTDKVTHLDKSEKVEAQEKE